MDLEGGETNMEDYETGREGDSDVSSDDSSDTLSRALSSQAVLSDDSLEASEGPSGVLIHPKS